MKRYPAYKDSGIEWIGQIPAHWQIKRLKYLIKGKLEYGANEVAEMNDCALPRYIRITDFDESGNLREDTFKSLPHERAKDYMLADGDILFARSGATVGKTFQFRNYKGKACFAGYLIKASPNENEFISDFLYYFTKSNAYENWKSAIFNQATIQNIGADKYQILVVPLTAVKEQEEIVSFLTLKTAQIDDLISKKERMIELLKEERTAIVNQAVTKGLNPDAEMKDSGVEWLGKVPTHWEIKKLKFNASVSFSNVDKKTEKGELPVRLCNYLDVYYNELITPEFNFMEASATLEEIRKFQLRSGDIILTKDSEEWDDIAVPAYVVSEIPNVICGYHLAQMRPKMSVFNGKYLFWLLSANCINYQFQIEASGITRFSLSNYTLSNAIVLIPPIDEQLEIVSFLDNKTMKIDAQIEIEKKSIEYLKEYRTALISEVVTGKIDVGNEINA